MLRQESVLLGLGAKLGVHRAVSYHIWDDPRDSKPGSVSGGEVKIPTPKLAGIVGP